MSLEVAVQENTAALNRLIALLQSGATIAPNAELPEVKEATKGLPSEKPAAKASATKSSKPAATTSDSSEKLDAEAVKKAALGLAKVKGRDALVKLLGEFGVQKTPDLKEEQYADFVAKCTAAQA